MKQFVWLLPVIILIGYLSFSSVPRDEIVIYSGRSKALVDPLIQRFESETGIKVSVKYGGTTQLAVAIMEEGSRSPADLFWAQDAGALGALNNAGVLNKLPDNLASDVAPLFRHQANAWVATSGRARVLAYSSSRVNAASLPSSVFDLSDSRWRGRVAWAPTNGSFQSFVSAMIVIHGEETTKKWLTDVRNNGAKNFANNNAILQGIAAGEADIGITNHYYLYRAKAENPNFPVEQTSFSKGDVGNLINVAGIAQLKSGKNKAQAERFIAFLLSDETQNWFMTEVYEYPIRAEIDKINSANSFLDMAPEIELDKIDNLETTLKVLREAGLL